MPLQSWGPSFNFSIWFVELTGIDNWDIVKPCIEWFYSYREREAVRLCLKLIRQLDYQEAFDALQSRSNVLLEDPLLSKLHDLLVKRGNYEETELFMEQCATSKT
ncbi:unnamed protein product, partial [Timema podura]|nr:unnamed protein product [Timema podura]